MSHETAKTATGAEVLTCAAINAISSRCPGTSCTLESFVLSFRDVFVAKIEVVVRVWVN